MYKGFCFSFSFFFFLNNGHSVVLNLGPTDISHGIREQSAGGGDINLDGEKNDIFISLTSFFHHEY